MCCLFVFSLSASAETRSTFDLWVKYLGEQIKDVLAEIKHEGWIWRKYQLAWFQRFALIFEGVLYFFQTRDMAEKFKRLAARDQDSVFLASQLAEGVCVSTYLIVAPFCVFQQTFLLN